MATSRRNGNLQTDVFELGGLRGAKRQAEVHVAVAFHLRPADHLHAIGLAGGFPGHRAAGLSDDLRLVAGPGQRSGGGFHDELHRLGQYFPRRRGNVVHGMAERALNAVEQPAGGNVGAAAQDAHCLVGNRHGRVGRKDLVVEADLRVEPAESGKPPQVAVAGVVQHLVGHGQRNPHRRVGHVLRPDRHRALIRARGGILGHLHADPQRLHPALGHVYRLGERPAEPVGPARVEAAHGLGGNRTLRTFSGVKETRMFFRSCPVAYTPIWKT